MADDSDIKQEAGREIVSVPSVKCEGATDNAVVLSVNKAAASGDGSEIKAGNKTDQGLEAKVKMDLKKEEENEEEDEGDVGEQLEEDAQEVGKGQTDGATPVDGTTTSEAVKKQKKKKNKKKKKALANSNGLLVGSQNVNKPLPTQSLVQAQFPWKTAVKPNRGRCVVAARALKAGEVVVAEAALAFIPREEYAAVVCHACCRFFEEEDRRTPCLQCNFAVYCKDCEARELPRHQQQPQACFLARRIPAIATQADCDPALLRLIVALARIRQRPPPPAAATPPLDGREEKTNPWQGQVVGGVVEPTFMDALGLASHQEDMPARWRQSVRSACQQLQVAASTHGPPQSFPPLLLEAKARGGAQEQQELREGLGSVESLEYLGALVNTNAHGMGAHGPLNTDVALGIFPFVSLINHSCRPNCVFVADGRVMYVRVTQDVPMGTELCVSYINLYDPRAVRRQGLMATKHFFCRCDRCEEPFIESSDRFLEGVLCDNRGCKGGVMVPTVALYNSPPNPAAWECDTCHRVVDPSSCKGLGPWNWSKKAAEALEAAMGPYTERKKEARRLYEDLLTEFSGKLHPLHLVLFDARTPLMNCCRRAGDAAEGIRHCMAVIDALEKVVPTQILEQANFYACLAEMQKERAETDGMNPRMAKRLEKQAAESLAKAASIRRICLGPTPAL
eukprot:TRINITY_DN15910_c0_g1_i1.p1 TRINITY_DN15910_c0_g1~~TRINITY_DN15910_c0_g1_i1.p1  ORF type:complete len:702 (-),score=142.92 TRINITY_DN15910_c0_g1_i1:735-2768(-)